GIKTANGTDYDIRTIKLTSSLGVSWVQDYDSGAKVDSVSAIICGASGGITLTGWSSTQQGGSDILTLKYKGDGNLAWAKKRTVHPQDVLSKGRAVAVDANENIIVAGDLKGAMVVTSYGPSGEVIWEKEIKNADVQSNRPLGLVLNQEDEIFLTSLVRKQSGKSYASYKINTFLRPQDQVLDQSGNPAHLKDEVIVRFKPGVVKNSFIDNTDLRYGRLGDILDDNFCLQTMIEQLSGNAVGDWVAVKIHRNMTTADSVATTRLGREIKVPDFYNTLVLLSGSRSLDETDISEILEDSKLKCCIRYAEVNQFVTPDDCEPNDPLYVNQGNLHPTATYPDGDINMEEAWCIAGGGSSDVKVAIIDTGVRWSHEDFAGTVVIGGMDYTNGSDILSNNENDVTDHGTRVASIVGSVRNNAIGVAGIAGGSGSADGVRLVALKSFGAGQDKFIESFGDAVDDYEVQVINCSGGYNDDEISDNNLSLLREKLHHANRMGVVVCASRGNSANDPNPSNPNSPRYPGTAQDEWVLCVGGTGTNGLYNPECRFGEPIDIAAPSRWQLARSAANFLPNTTTPSDQAYGGISFTSGATPHATGLAALMIGYAASQGTQLVQEDIEYIIQASATDVGANGYDGQTGHGRLNAGAALQMIEGPDCHVYHFGTDVNTSTKTQQLLETGVTLELTEPYTTENGQTFDAGAYTADVYKVTATVAHPLPANSTITHYWERHSSSTVFRHYETVGGQNLLIPVENVLITSAPTTGIAPLEGYVYYLKNGDCSIEGWIPASPDDAQLTYSLIGCASTATSEVVAGMMQLFPNPATNQLTIALPGNERPGDCQLSILDFSGRQVMLQQVNAGSDMSIGISQLPQGVYTCLLQTGGKSFSSKFIKF
ncbi:MAG: T9SS type A sorting domain-containing protein, partial [Saprospiraceae bacterium]